MDFPRVKKLEEFFAKKFRAKKHKLAKMDIARAIADILEKNSQDKKDEKWATSKTLIEEIEKRYNQEERKSEDF